MYLSLPLPSTVTRPITVTVFYGDGSGLPMPYTVTLLKQGCCKDLIEALSTACCLKSDEILLLAEVTQATSFVSGLLSFLCSFLFILVTIVIQMNRFIIIKFIDIWRIHQNRWLQLRRMTILWHTGYLKMWQGKPELRYCTGHRKSRITFLTSEYRGFFIVHCRVVVCFLCELKELCWPKIICFI